jgi:hypothetical protein
MVCAAAQVVLGKLQAKRHLASNHTSSHTHFFQKVAYARKIAPNQPQRFLKRSWQDWKQLQAAHNEHRESITAPPPNQFVPSIPTLALSSLSSLQLGTVNKSKGERIAAFLPLNTTDEVQTTFSFINHSVSEGTISNSNTNPPNPPRTVFKDKPLLFSNELPQLSNLIDDACVPSCRSPTT